MFELFGNSAAEAVVPGQHYKAHMDDDEGWNEMPALSAGDLDLAAEGFSFRLCRDPVCKLELSACCWACHTLENHFHKGFPHAGTCAAWLRLLGWQDR